VSDYMAQKADDQIEAGLNEREMMIEKLESLQKENFLIRDHNKSLCDKLELLQKELQEKNEAIKRGRRIFKLMCEKQRKDRDKINELYEVIEKYGAKE
jgi:hypothetical protein